MLKNILNSWVKKILIFQECLARYVKYFMENKRKRGKNINKAGVSLKINSRTLSRISGLNCSFVMKLYSLRE